ncbi:MAG TPA: hypothetical protein VKU35_04955, partial [Candidatus Limnocylindria bacterium]|nr:hypothetical protein [Candidatus Limnocylindria bacterium]
MARTAGVNEPLKAVPEQAVPEQAGDELYGVDPAAFVAARDALVKRLRAEGDRAEADRVSRLRRPTVTAWALNQVARHQPGLIAAVLDSGASLRSAMEHAAAGDASGLRQAQLASRRVMDAAVEAAAGYLPDGSGAAGAGARVRMAATLRSAVVDDEVAGRLRAGVLQQDQETPGFGFDAESLPAMAPPSSRSGRTPEVARAKAGPQNHDTPDAEQQAPDRRVSQDARVERLAQRAERLRADAEDAQGRARHAATTAVEAQRQATLAAGAAAKAERQATLAASAADKAAGAAAAAE